MDTESLLDELTDCIADAREDVAHAAVLAGPIAAAESELERLKNAIYGENRWDLPAATAAARAAIAGLDLQAR